MKKQLLNDESSIKAKDISLRTRQAELAKIAKDTAERKAAEAAAVRAKTKAELVKKSEGEVAAVTSQVEKIKQVATSTTTSSSSTTTTTTTTTTTILIDMTITSSTTTIILTTIILNLDLDYMTN